VYCKYVVSFEIKYCIGKVLVKLDVSIKIKSLSFSDICLFELFSLLGGEELILEVCLSILDTPSINIKSNPNESFQFSERINC